MSEDLPAAGHELQPAVTALHLCVRVVWGGHVGATDRLGFGGGEGQVGDYVVKGRGGLRSGEGGGGGRGESGVGKEDFAFVTPGRGGGAGDVPLTQELAGEVVRVMYH